MNFKRFEEIAFALLPTTHPDNIRCRHFAFLLKKGRIVTIGFNKRKSHPINHRYGYFESCGLHAELDSLLKAKRDEFKGYSLAVLRIDRNNKLNQSAPCRFCTAALSTLGINDIYHTNEHGDWIKKQI